MLGAGLASGIIASIPQAVAAAHKMTSQVLTATSALSARSATAGIGSALAASAVGPAVGAGGSGTVEIHVHAEGSQIMSGADLEKFVNRIGKRLATVRLPASGNRLTIR